ncbi:MAG: hypothetical protein H8E31_08705 [Planctomycetes bacterium]|nr:hypothetical protein [Planctomycetota bacterium]
MILLLAPLLLAAPQAAPAPHQPTLRIVLVDRADELALALASSLRESGVLEGHSIEAFAFPGALGDVEGAMGDRLVSFLLRDLGLERIAERREREDLLADCYRTSGFEQGLYDPESLKRLGGQFRDNEAALGVRVYTVEGPESLQVYAQAALWNVGRATEVWNDRARIDAPWVEPPPPPESWTAKWPQALIVLAALVVMIAIFRRMDRTEQIRKATKRGGQAVGRKEQRGRDRNLLEEGARRLDAAADRLSDGMATALHSERDSWFDSVERLRKLAKALAAAPTGSVRGAVEEARDPVRAALKGLADQDERMLGLVEETEGAAGAIARLPQGATAATMLKRLDALAEGVQRRLGERSDLIKTLN